MSLNLIHGCRNEQFWFGESHEDQWTDFDLGGCYSMIMSLISKNIKFISKF